MKAKGYRVRVTTSGFLYIAITIILSVGAVNTGNNLLYLMASLLLALMVLSGVSSFGNFFFLDVSLVPPREIFAGIPAPFRLIIGKKRGRSFFLSCETRYGSIRLPIIKRPLETTLWLTIPARGKTTIETLRIHSGFPLGFFRRFKVYAANLDVTVFPRPISRVLPPLTGRSRGGERSGSFQQGELGDEIKELRNYRDTDPLKWVDWKATARKGEMVVRDFYYLEGDTLTIDIARKGGGWEIRLSEACYLILEAYRRKLAIGMILPDREMGSGRGEKHKRRLLEALSSV